MKLTSLGTIICVEFVMLVIILLILNRWNGLKSGAEFNFFGKIQVISHVLRYTTCMAHIFILRQYSKASDVI